MRTCLKKLKRKRPVWRYRHKWDNNIEMELQEAGLFYWTGSCGSGYRQVDDSSEHCDESYVYWTVHHRDSWVKRDQLDATCFIIILFSAQHVSDVAVWLWWCGIRMQAEVLVPQPAYGYHTTIATLQRNTNTHRTRYNPWSNSTN